MKRSARRKKLSKLDDSLADQAGSMQHLGMSDPLLLSSEKVLTQ